MGRSNEPATLIAGEHALADFRQGLSGDRAFEMLDAAHGRLLVQLPVGAGKTEWLRKIILHAAAAPRYDLTLVLAPRHDILSEIISGLPPTLSPVLLTPRPHARCGPLDAQWCDYEGSGCGVLGRAELCEVCRHRRDCTWPNQYGRELQGKRLILAPQHHLVINPQFVQSIRQQTRAKRPLVMLDESNLLLRNSSVLITQSDMTGFVAAQEAARIGEANSQSATDWLEMSRLLSQARNCDLHGRWPFPQFNGKWALQVQRAGQQILPGQFRFLGYDLHHFSNSDRGSRERLINGDIRFAGPPRLGNEFIVFTGSMPGPLARYRIDPDHKRPTLSSPFANYRFEHPSTEWTNIASIAGAAKYFPSNAPIILEFFAQMIVNNIRAGKRTLLVARKKFFGQCRAYLQPRLTELVGARVRIVTSNWDRNDLDDPHNLPLINYGISGVNRFEHFDAAYCLSGYYVTSSVVARAAQDIEPESRRWPIKIRLVGMPRRRVATVEHVDAANTIVPTVVQGLLDQYEPEVVVQAVGRVRPFTRPREIFTFHVGQLPGVRFTREFLSIGQARGYFGIPTRRTAEREHRKAEARRLRGQGKRHQEIAAEIDVSLSTVKRYLRDH